MKGESANPSPASPSQDFLLIRDGAKSAWVKQAESQAVSEALLHGVGCEAAGVGGRGTIQRFPCGDSYGIIRIYQRGGVMRHLIRHYYLLQNRALRELEMHRLVFANGLPTPEPLGACWERHGLWFRGAIATRELDAITLQQYINETPDSSRLLRTCGVLFRQMHDMGVYHADLHPGNVLVVSGKSKRSRKTTSEGLYVIDFDKAFLAKSLTPVQRAKNLFRFRRSLEKRGSPMTLFDALCDGYGTTDLPEWMNRVYRAKGRMSDIAAGR